MITYRRVKLFIRHESGKPALHEEEPSWPPDCRQIIIQIGTGIATTTTSSPTLFAKNADESGTKPERLAALNAPVGILATTLSVFILDPLGTRRTFFNDAAGQRISVFVSAKPPAGSQTAAVETLMPHLQRHRSRTVSTLHRGTDVLLIPTNLQLAHPKTSSGTFVTAGSRDAEDVSRVSLRKHAGIRRGGVRECRSGVMRRKANIEQVNPSQELPLDQGKTITPDCGKFGLEKERRRESW